ncbi:hypothetical protein [Serratia sp. AKBS12]|uniref:hypothetical protein n=1 Tax=Serratia sp. AKBS12 TaxID=2974597 RepID=UPI0021664E73|nr:hypothetical protein [Serratia sp. AKBS12]MCS3407747.1 hypothetical protein [Serratia sp. AKBS12]
MQGSLVNNPCVAGGADWVMTWCISLRWVRATSGVSGVLYRLFEAFCQPRTQLNSTEEAFFAAICFNPQENRSNGSAETFFVIKIAIDQLA